MPWRLQGKQSPLLRRRAMFGVRRPSLRAMGYGRINVPPVAMPVAVRKALLALGESRVDLATALTRHGVRAVVTV